MTPSPRSPRSGRLALLVAACAALALVGWPSPAEAQMKLAIIDLRRAVADTEDGLRVQAKLQELFDSRQGDYEHKEKSYNDAKAELERLAKEGKTPEEELRKRYRTLEKLGIELQAASLTYRREMQQQETELLNPIVKQVLGLLRQLAAQEGYDVVLNKEAVPFYRRDLDVTDRIIQMYNQSSRPESPAPSEKDPAKPAKDPKKGAGKKEPAPKEPPKPEPAKPTSAAPKAGAAGKK
jgi:outer membrane protein